LDNLVLAVVLPLIGLVFGTAALGAEIEDGTAIYLLTKPIERWRILLVKIGVATAATLALTLSAALIASLIALGGDDPYGLTAGFVIAIAVGSLAYSALFVALSVRTSRALLVGLIYVFVWEAIVPTFFDGTRWVSIRQYMLGLADLVSSAPAAALDADLSGGSAAIAAIILIIVSVWFGTRLINRFEVGERL
ncbi:MAG TPA: ABC transporter permease subunit, partial [Dehalococcoidia bacterium]|nr:ABC transporter permease subunit [Dehalococcoidia bacterium]